MSIICDIQINKSLFIAFLHEVHGLPLSVWISWDSWSIKIICKLSWAYEYEHFDKEMFMDFIMFSEAS